MHALCEPTSAHAPALRSPLLLTIAAGARGDALEMLVCSQ